MTGRIFYVMGASGVGKDSLLGYVRGRVRSSDRILFAHRYITRPAGGNENHVALSEPEFTRRLQAGLFCFSWASHGFRYGIGIEIDFWTKAGFDVVINGSREAYAAARMERPVEGVLITASHDTLRDRLVARGRESERDVEARLARSATFAVPSDVRAISNDGPLEHAGNALLEVLRASRSRLTGSR